MSRSGWADAARADRGGPGRRQRRPDRAPGSAGGKPAQGRPGRRIGRGARDGLGDGPHLRTSLFGNVVLSKFPIRHHQQYDLTWKTCEARLVQRVEVLIDEQHALHLYNVHLGTALRERRNQAERLAAVVHDRRVTGPKIVLGDFNEWARGLATDVLAERLESVDIRNYIRFGRSYPGFFPILHLDHIYYEGHVEVVHVELPRSRLAKVASDHLPLVADLKIRF
jgi:endonuclease/exonuclease/phosphatase family metal-dependent hydrolase